MCRTYGYTIFILTLGAALLIAVAPLLCDKSSASDSAAKAEAFETAPKSDN